MPNCRFNLKNDVIPFCETETLMKMTRDIRTQTLDAQAEELKLGDNSVTKAYKPNQGHCSGMFYSFKTKKQCPWRGIMERNAMTILDLDPEVREFLVECITIPYVMPSGRKSHYKPDRLIHFHGNRPSLLIEIKPKRKLRKNREVWDAKFAAAMAEAQSRGWEFEVWTEEHINGKLLDNSDFLRIFVQHPTNTSLQSRLLDALSTMRKTTIAKLLSHVAADNDEHSLLIPQLWQLIALRKIHTDWRKLITIHSDIQV